MVSPRRLAAAIFRGDGQDAVQSFSVQARAARPERAQGQFEVLVRHLFDRLLNNEAFGEDAALRVTQLAYAIALPGLLVAMFLMPLYHRPPPLHLDRPFWSQACDHLFYVTYSFVVLGTAMVFQWELLFPDLLDVYVLSSLPIRRLRLLLGRVTALAIFLAMVHVETSLLGALFLPAVADLKLRFWRHFAAHAAAVSIAAVFAVVFFVALQGVLGCLPGRRLAARASSVVRTASVIALLSVLFLFPLVAHSLQNLLDGQMRGALWFPPFWFLGVYETVLWGSGAPEVFHQLAAIALEATSGLTILGALLYPLAYARRVKHLVEGSEVQRKGSRCGALIRQLLHATAVRTPRQRAIFHFAAQTIARLPRLQLYLAMYAGVGLALVISGLVAFRVDDAGRAHLVVPPEGIRIALPVLVFWTVAGLRTALGSPLGRSGSWVFRVIIGTPEEEDIRGAAVLVGLLATALGIAATGALALLAPKEMRLPGQTVLATGLAVILADLAFLGVRTIPFTAVRVTTTIELPMILVRYFVVFPAFALTMVGMGAWIEASASHLALAAAAFVLLHLALKWVQGWVLRRPAPAEDLLFAGLRLRDD